MRSNVWLGFTVAAFFGIFAINAAAHPRKTDYHPASCQVESVTAGTGGSGGAPHLEYGNSGITPRGGEISVVCPMLHLTFGDDTVVGTSWVTWNAKTTWTSGTFTCNLRSDSDTTAVIPIQWNHAGVVGGDASMIMPALSSVGPFGMQLVCTIGNGNTLGPIEVEID